MVCTSWYSSPIFVIIEKRLTERLQITKEGEETTVKDICKCALRTYMAKCLAETRKELRLSQARFSERPMIDARSYAGS